MSMTDGAAPAATGSEGLSFEDAMSRLSGPPAPGNEAEDTEQATAATDGSDGAAEYESDPDDGDDAGPEEAPGETDGEDEADEPPIQPPRTWTKAEKEAFALLPREHQQAIVARESERDSYYQRGLNEAAQKARQADERAKAAEQARQQYEAALPQLYAKLYGDFQAKFGDIKTQADITALRQNDPMRWMEYRDELETLNNTYRQSEAAQQRQQQEAIQQFEQFVNEQDAAFLAKRPEFADSKKAAQLQGEVAKMLVDDYEFSKEELQASWMGRPLSLRDHRLQLVIADALAYRSAKAKAKEAARKPVPPVQRPGTAPTKGEAQAVDLKILKDKVRSSGREEDAVAYLMARGRKRA